MSEKKPAATKNKPEHSIRVGEVIATIYRRQSNAGFAYYDYTLTRSWKSISSGKESHGTSFFGQHQEDIIRVVQEATQWLRNKTRPEVTDEPLEGLKGESA